MHARVKRLIFGASDPKAGAVGSVMSVINHPQLNHTLEVSAGVLAARCQEMVQAFFREKRVNR